MGKSYVIARAASGRPTLQHRLNFMPNGDVRTLCGQDTSKWSQAYFERSIEPLLCRRCRRMGG